MANLDCSKLNKCLQELDTLENIVAVKGENTLHMHFGCPNGGCYEDVTLVISFIFPAVFHLPAFVRGTFECIVCGDDKIKEIVPTGFQDTGSLLVSFRIDSQATPFYVYCDEVEWKLTGCGPIQNEHELISHDKIAIADLPNGFMDNLNKFNEVLCSALQKAVEECGLEDASKIVEVIEKLKRNVNVDNNENGKE